MIQPSSFLNNYSEEAFKDFRTRVLLDSGFFESEEGTKPTFVYNNSILTTPLDSDAQEFIKATGIKDNTIVSYINTYVVKLKRFGLWSKIKALYPFISDNRNLASFTESINAVSLGTNATLSTTEPSPTGSLNAVRVNNAGANPYNFQNFTLPQNTQYTFSVYVRAVTGTVNFGMYVNYNNGSGNLPNTTFTATTTWQRFNITFNTSTFPNNWFTVLNFMTGNIEFWGWQLELGSTATAYQPVLAASSTVYTNQFKYNLKDPRDLDAAFRLTFSGGWQFSQLGATPNGTNGVADTKLSPITNLSASSTHMSFYSRTNKNELSYELAVAGHYSMILYQNTFYVNFDTSGSYPANFPLTDTRGYYIGSRINNTNVNGYRNGIKVIDNVALPSNLGSGTIKIGNGNGPYYSSKECGLVSIGEGLTDADATNLYYITEELQANLKRNVSPYTQFRGILDEYPGAAAAYSLRRLSGSYGGPLIKVRRSSDNTEQDIFPLGNGSLDTTSLLSFVGANNGFVTTWYDQSGNGNNAAQGTAASQPQIVSSGSILTENTKPSIRFNNHYMIISSVLLNSTNVSAYFAALAKTTYRFGGIITNKLAALDDANAINWLNSGKVEVVYNGVLSSQATQTNTATSLFQGTALWNSTNVTLRTNGTQDATSLKIGTQTFSSQTWVGAYRLDTNNLGNFSIPELIVYQSDQSANNNGIESNINTYYNLYWDGSRKGLLDFYPNAAAAYSVRALSSSYRGPLVKVRRSSDNVERDFFALQNGNLDTFGLATFCAGTDGFVTTWYDQSGVGRNATQTTAIQQPQIVSSGVVILQNSKPCVQFSGFSNSLILSSNLYNNTTPKETFALFNTSGSTGVVIGGFNSSFFDSFGEGVYVNTTIKASQLASSVGVLLNSTISPNGRYLVDAKMVNGANEIFVNAVSKATSTANQSFQGYTNRIGGDAFNNGGWLNGNIQEILMYAADKTSDRNAISSNINTYYTIY
jgi:hypothetical protein